MATTTYNNFETGIEYRAYEPENIIFFSSKWQVNDDAEHCICCGRKVSQNNRQGVVIVAGGDLAVHREDMELANDGGFMGFWAIGSECIKEIPQEYRFTYNLKEVK